ncbi:hypothetical protein GGX14DRAFT_534293 [Mycena pura]|uniref:DUF6589 domain-containing protein n=1 Tax=Mycena pura TaxID=153505 RepID=A0AAD6VHP7_9AGAR|nr:hypothetical protein GGX14DRAFT_534293 [Mycena pura]
MPRNYSIRPSFTELNSDDFKIDEDDAASTIGATSSPPGSDDFGNEDSDITYGSNSRAPKSTATDKTLAILAFMKENYPQFSLRDLLTELFTSEHPSITNVTNSYLGRGGRKHLLETAIGDSAIEDEHVADWIMAKATVICTQEVSHLTDRASKGKFFEDAKCLRVPAGSITVKLLQSFSLSGLLFRYDRTTAHLQKFLKALIGKDSLPSSNESRTQRSPDMGRTLITSMILNLRSRETNLHAAMISLMLWDGGVSRRLVQALNHYGICTSYRYQGRAVGSVSRDGVQIARSVANNPENLLLLPFNWMQTAWEAAATHGNISHDQVSALLVVLALPDGAPPTEAARIAGVDNFAQAAQTRHHMPADQALEEILPTAADQHTFSNNAIKHVANILCDEVEGFSSHRKDIPDFFDPHALANKETEEYVLPTYDQEQASTRGNMLVIEHYFCHVLGIPKKAFEERFFFLLGDRLTTARDRAAQDQRAVDRSEYRVDHLSSFEVTSGIMHFVMNQIHNIGKNTWGGANKDPVSLLTLLEKLPNRTNINLRKIDFYAWLRLLDTVLRALVLRAAMVVLGVSDLKHEKLSTFMIVADFLLPSLDCLEAEGIKTLPGSTQSGNAVLLMHDLMTLREMRHAIKYGHPERMERILKYWTPMFYAGGSFNYANESMELLHNLNHDWPPDISPILRGGMLINNKDGKAGNFKETDIRVEQLNKSIKSHARGANASPGLLEKITPAIGHVQELTEKMFDDLGVNDEDQHHAHVRQHKDVILLLEHLSESNIFDFSRDKSSDHTVIDLYRTGLYRLAGPDGGHAKHLRRHLLRSRTLRSGACSGQ